MTDGERKMGMQMVGGSMFTGRHLNIHVCFIKAMKKGLKHTLK